MTRVVLKPLSICLGIAVLAVAALPDSALQPVLLGLILLGGMPHGGLDLLLASTRFPLARARDYALFLVAYLGLAGAVVLLWLLAPTAALLAFLGYSALHFGADWAERSWIGGWAAGLALLAQPALAAPDETARLFAALGADGEAVRLILATAGLIAVPFALWALRDRLPSLATLAGLAGAAVVLHPLAWFFVYFCGLHGPHHMRRVADAHGLSTTSLLRHWIGPAVAAGLLVVLSGVMLWYHRTGVEEAAMQVIFIGFAALTVPHMVLVDLAANSGGWKNRWCGRTKTRSENETTL